MSIPKFNVSALKQSIERQQAELKRDIFRSVAMDVWAKEGKSNAEKNRKKFNIKENEAVMVFRYSLTREDRKASIGDIEKLELDLENKDYYKYNDSFSVQSSRDWHYLLMLYVTCELFLQSSVIRESEFLLEYLKNEFPITFKTEKLMDNAGLLYVKYKLPSVDDINRSEYHKIIDDLIKSMSLDSYRKTYIERTLIPRIETIIRGFSNSRLQDHIDEFEDDRETECLVEGLNLELVEIVELL